MGSDGEPFYTSAGFKPRSHEGFLCNAVSFVQKENRLTGESELQMDLERTRVQGCFMSSSHQERVLCWSSV